MPSQPNILIIEDDPAILKMLCLMLQEDGFQVRCADNGKSGLAQLKDDWVDIILTDIMMPEMDGIELIRVLQRRHNRPKIVAISGGGSRGLTNLVLESAILLGAHAVLPKPFTHQELTAILKMVMA